MKTETIAISELRANLMNVLKRVEAGTNLTITSRGREIACLVPPKKARNHARSALKKLGKTAVLGDILSPTDAEWKALE